MKTLFMTLILLALAAPARAASTPDDCDKALTAKRAVLHFTGLSPKEIAAGYRDELSDLEDLTYEGDPSLVGQAIDQLIAEERMSDWSNVLAIRYPGGTELRDKDRLAVDAQGKLSEIILDEENDDLYHQDMVDLWNGFDTSNGDILVLSDLSYQGDGTEMYATVISRKPTK